jgi:hypothetical protein
MNKENSKKLFDRFEFFHPELSPAENLMCFGFECSDGWFDLIWKLCENIETSLKGQTDWNPTIPPFRVIQVKEKFGGLRFYTNWGNDEIFKHINEAESKSHKTCEMCGKFGKVRRDGWVKTLCDECAKDD